MKLILLKVHIAISIKTQYQTTSVFAVEAGSMLSDLAWMPANVFTVRPNYIRAAVPRGLHVKAAFRTLVPPYLLCAKINLHDLQG